MNRDIEYINSDMEKIVDEYIHSERDRKIFKRKYIDGIGYERLAEEFDLSVTQVKRIIYKHENTVFKNYERMVNEMKNTIQGN